jgi:PHP family Zn ribbon phosphoesterase
MIPDSYEYMRDGLGERRLIERENGRSMGDCFDGPDEGKWSNRDCPYCGMIFSVELVGRKWRCYRCGRFVR